MVNYLFIPAICAEQVVINKGQSVVSHVIEQIDS